MNPENTQEVQQDDPVSMSRQILQIEKDMKEQISAIQEVLAMMIQPKLDLEKLKSMTRDKIASLTNEQE